MALISELCDGRYNGKPILVIGGGPSVARDLRHIPLNYPACVISANQHGFKQDRFKVDFIVNVDYTFNRTATPMREYLKQFNTPTINRWSWATYRIPEFSFNGDSGLTAIVVAVMLGGHPVVPLGIDRNVGNKRYFWETTPEKGWGNRAAVNIDNIRINTQKCVEFCRESQIRMFDGPMRAYWPEWNHPVEVLPPWKQCTAPQCHLKGKLYTLNRQIFLHPTDPVAHGPVLLTDSEANPHLRSKAISHIIPAD